MPATITIAANINDSSNSQPYSISGPILSVRAAQP
jgi:hypothetical protein